MQDTARGLLLRGRSIGFVGSLSSESIHSRLIVLFYYCALGDALISDLRAGDDQTDGV